MARICDIFGVDEAFCPRCWVADMEVLGDRSFTGQSGLHFPTNDLTGAFAAVALLFPGLVVGIVVARLFGITSGVLAYGMSNGAVYGFLRYGWFRLTAALRRKIPTWFSAIANSVAHRGNRQ